MTDNEPDQQSGADATEENPCPPGYRWDAVKQECVPIIIDDEEE